jgi:anti-sigma B factor antagonist
MSGIQLVTELRGGWHILSVRGRVDTVTADEFAAALLAAVASHQQVAIDCSDLDFISSAGINSLLKGARAARGAGCELRVCAPSPRVTQIFEISRIHELLNVHEALPC